MNRGSSHPPVDQRKNERSMSIKKQPGFALTELLLPLGIGAVLLTMVSPGQSGGQQQSGALIASNERAAIEALRKIAAAQAHLASSGAIDTDDDGVGEYAFLGELAGTAPLRVYDAVDGLPALDPGLVLAPPLLPPDFGNIILDFQGESVLLLDGYLFKMFLPDVAYYVPNGVHVEGIAEDGPHDVGGSAGALFPDPDTSEAFWCCYAWPLEDQITGQRAFFVNQEGRVLQTRNDGRSLVYEGLLSTPDFDAAFSDRPEPPNGLTGMGARLGNRPRRANDGNVWTPIGR
jgi:hypothetical protein